MHNESAETPLIELREEAGIAVITLSNPARLNAFSKAMRLQLYPLLLALESRADIRVILLTGAGGNFCSGGDISEMQRRTVLEARERMDLPTRIFKLLVSGSKPVIAAVEGNAAGAGMSLVAASDYCVAARDARFAAPFIRMGMIPDTGGVWSLLHRLGQRRTFELCALAEPIDAEKALRIDLINEICEPGAALEQAMAVARRLIRQPALALALLKSALAVGADTLDQAVNSEIASQGVLMSSDDYAEAVAAFKEKRKPTFTGR